MQDFLDLLTGRFDASALADRPARVIRVYLSCTATDMIEERTALMQRVYPKLREYCRQKYGLEFQMVDPRWGSNQDWDEWDRDRELCLREIIECKRLSPGPNFVCLLGQRYGQRAIPLHLPAEHFEAIREALRKHRNSKTRDSPLLDIWYRKDTNVVPTAYRLVPQEDGTAGQQRYYEKNKLILGRTSTDVSWEETRPLLQRLLTLGMKYCVDEGTLDQEVEQWYLASDLEKEVELGVLRAYEPPRNCIVMSRDIVDLKNYTSHKNAPRFMELLYNDNEERWEIDEEAHDRLAGLKNLKLRHVLVEENIHEFSVLWRHETGVDPNLHKDYLDEFLRCFEASMCQQVDRHVASVTEVRLAPLVEEVRAHWMVARDRSRGFTGREEVLEVIQSYIVSNDNKPLVLYGESGAGKTSLMAKAATLVHTWADDDCIAVIRFIGSTVESFDTRQLLYTMCLQVAAVLGHHRDLVPNEYKELQQYFFDVLAHFPADKTLVIFLDALHILVPQYNAHYLHWLPKVLNENVKIIVSTLPDTHSLLHRLKTEIVVNENNFIELAPLQLSECMQLLEWRLAEEGRCLHPDQQAMVVEAFQECSYPLYVSLMLTLARHWASSQDPPPLPKGMKEFIHHMLDALEVRHGRTLASRAAAYLTASTTGVSDCEMEDLLSLDDAVLAEVFGDTGSSGHVTYTSTNCRLRRLPSVRWFRLKHDIRDFLIERESEGVTVWFWSHRMFVDIVRSRYLADEGSRKEVHSALADYHLGIYHGKPKPYSVTMPSGTTRTLSADRLVPSQPLTFVDGESTRYNKRKYEQVPRHLYLSGRLTELNSLVLFSYSFLYNKTKALSLEHILADFVLNPGVEATLVERALRDAQPFMEVNIDNMAAEITGRLLCYYTSHPNIRKLIQECDTAGLSQCALIPNSPYHQVPGSPLRYTIETKHAGSHIGLFGEDSRYVLVKNPDQPLVQKFDLATGEHRADIDMSIGTLQLTPSAHLTVILDHVTRKSIKIHSTEDGRFLGQLLPTAFLNLKPENKFTLSPLAITDAFLAFTITTDTSILCLADLEFCKFSEKIELHGRSTVCQITPDSRYVFCNSGTNLFAYDVCTMEQTAKLTTTHRPNHLVFSSDGERAFYASRAELRVHGLVLKEGAVALTFKIPLDEHFPGGDKIESLVMSHDDDMLLIVGSNHLHVYHISTERHLVHFSRPAEIPEEFKLPRSHYRNISFTQAAFSPDDKFVMATIFRNVYIWTVATGRLLTTLQAPVGIIDQLLIPTARGQVVTHLDGTRLLHVWSLGDAIGHVGMLDRLTRPIQRVITTQDDKVGFIGCHGSDEIGVLDMTSGQLIDLLTHESEVVNFTITPDGQYAMVSVRDAKPGTFNKIWHVSGRRVIYEYGHVAATTLPLSGESTVISITQDESKFKQPYRISQLKFRNGTFEEYQFDQTMPFMFNRPFITPGDKYLVVLSAEGYDETQAHYVNPTICAVSLQTNVDMALYGTNELRQITPMRRILHVRPYAHSEYSVVVLYTNEPDRPLSRGGPNPGYDYAFGFMIFDIAAGVAVQVIENFVPPQTPLDALLFTRDVSICIDPESNVFDMATGYFSKQLGLATSHGRTVTAKMGLKKEGEPPRVLALGDTVAVYYDRCYLYALRVRDNACLGYVNVHGTITCVALCNDERTLVVGCEDGSLISYVLIDQSREKPETVLASVHSRQAALVQPRVTSAQARAWDKVDFTNSMVPPYSRPPSAIISGPNDRQLLKKVRPVSRTKPRPSDRPISDTRIYVNPNSQACVVM